MAASQLMRKDGFNDAAKVMTALQHDPELGTKLKTAISLDVTTKKPKANHIRTLGLIFRRGESKQGYEDWRKDVNKTVGYPAYPSYQTVAKAKEHLHPSVSTITDS